MYILSSSSADDTKDDYLRENADFHRTCSESELNALFTPSGKYKFGTYTTTFVVTCSVYLPWAMNLLKESGVKFVQRKVNNIDELRSIGRNFDVVMNCAGFGSKNLFPDNALNPIRGQVIRVHAPWIKCCYYVLPDLYVIPGSGHVTIGGLRQSGNSNTEVDPIDSEGLLKKATTFLPNLAKVRVLSEAVGLRPSRGASGNVRIEAETVGSTIVIHHYGHRGNGILLSPGSAIDAVNLLKEKLNL